MFRFILIFLLVTAVFAVIFHLVYANLALPLDHISWVDPGKLDYSFSENYRSPPTWILQVIAARIPPCLN